MLPCIVLAVLAPILAWVFGLSVNAKTLIAFAVSGLIVTAVGVVLIVSAIYLTFFAPASWYPPPQPHTHNMGVGLLFLFGVLIGAQVEMLGGILTLASCFIGLRQMARQRPRWFWILLAGALLPLIAAIGIGVFAQADPDLFGQVSPKIRGVIPVPLLIAAALPLIAAVVTLIYALRPARGAYRPIAVAPGSA